MFMFLFLCFYFFYMRVRTYAQHNFGCKGKSFLRNEQIFKKKNDFFLYIAPKNTNNFTFSC